MHLIIFVSSLPCGFLVHFQHFVEFQTATYTADAWLMYVAFFYSLLLIFFHSGFGSEWFSLTQGLSAYNLPSNFCPQ